MPDFFIVGHPKSGTTALYEMLRRHPQIYHARRSRSRGSSRASCIAALRRPARSRRRSRVPRAVRGGSAASSASARRRRSYLWSHTRRRADRRGAARRAHHRDPARAGELPALAAPRSSCRPTSRPRRTCARRSRSRASRREEHDVPTRSLAAALLYSEHVRYVEQLRRYRGVFAREQMLVLIYDDFRADNEATVRDGAALPRTSTTTLPVEAIEANPTVARALAAPARARSHAVSVGERPGPRRRQGARSRR